MRKFHSIKKAKQVDQKLDWYLFQVDVIAELHVLGVNPEDFETSDGVRNSNVNFAVESAETAEGSVDRVRSVRGGHDDDVSTLKIDQNLEHFVGKEKKPMIAIWRFLLSVLSFLFNNDQLGNPKDKFIITIWPNLTNTIVY